ncbi:hypothetical protein Tco_1217661 [Tanacetum coccineum]
MRGDCGSEKILKMSKHDVHLILRLRRGFGYENNKCKLTHDSHDSYRKEDGHDRWLRFVEMWMKGVQDGAFGGVGDEEVVVGEGVVVTSSSLEMLTNSLFRGIMLY